jgi:signal transduction histidine kinase
MRLSIRVKQIAGVTAIVGVAVVALSALYATRLANVVLDESHSRGMMLANTILHRAGDVVTAADPYAALRDDAGLHSILESSSYAANVTFAAIVDADGVVIVQWPEAPVNDLTKIGSSLPARRDLEKLLGESPVTKLQEIFEGDGQNLEVQEPLRRGGENFGSIRVGVSTLLMRRQLRELLQGAGLMALAALGVAIFVAGVLAQLLLRPIHVLRSGLTRLGKGEFGVTLDMPSGDEFGELGDFFNTVSQQLSADRTLLAGQKANLQSAVEHLEDAVALFNASGELLFSNPAMQHTLPGDAIGRVLEGLLPTGHPYRTIVEETLATRKSRGPVQIPGHSTAQIVVPGRQPAETAVVQAQAGTTARDGRPADEELVMTNAIAGTQGELVGVLLVSRNLASLSRMQSTLAYSRKLVALGRLTAGIAHEVKNPLNAMMIHLELLRTKIRGTLVTALQPEPVAAGGTLGLGPARAAPLPPPVQGALAHVEIIESEIRRLDEVVQGFLKFTRPEDLRLQPVRVASLFEELAPIIETEAGKHGVKVVMDVSAGTPNVNGDASMLRQAFLNLAINACQAMGSGGTLRLVATSASRNRVEVRVEDTGIGIKPEHLSRIFDLYFTTKERGTGIGLSMVYRIIQLHDGEIEVQSTPGRGTTFRVLLPRAQGM